MSGRSGLSANMQVGSVASLALDDSIAMRVKFDGPAPPQGELYFRGPVLTAFDGREWRALQPRLGGRFPPASFGSAQLEVSGSPVRYQVTLEPNNRPWLLVLDAAARPPAVAGVETFMTPELMWIANRPLTDLLRYRAESHPVFRHGPRTLAGVMPQYLELPAGFDPRTAGLAAALQRDPRWAGSPAALVQGALDHLRTGNYRYTLEPGVYGQHTADEFWFDRKEGFCEHIASAFVVLMRMMNIPARLVTGYQGGQVNPVDGYWIIRQSDAHAWTEVWLAGQGWVRVDPTSAVAPARTGTIRRLQAPAGVFATALGAVTPDLLASLRAGWEALNNGWNQWILNYTQSRQFDLLRNLGFESPSWEDLSFVLLGLMVAAALGGAAWTLWDRSQHDPWLRLLERVRRQLARAGLQVPVTAPPRQLATLVTARFGVRAAALANWLLQLETQRYAPRHDVSLRGLRRELRHMDWPA